MRRFILSAGAAATILAIGAVALIAPRSASADHTTYLDRTTFAVFFNSSLVINGSAPGSLRPVTSCVDNMPEDIKQQAVTAMSNWNSAIGYQAFWAVGAGQFFGPCSGSDPQVLTWTGQACNGAAGCNGVTQRDQTTGFVTRRTITINASVPESASGLLAVWTHELGHSLGLGEQYHEGANTCNASRTTIMNLAFEDQFGIVQGIVNPLNCNSTIPSVPQTFDYTSVTAATSAAFGSPPKPQILWIDPSTTTTVRVMFKIPNGVGYNIRRELCGGAFETAQNESYVNSDVFYADIPIVQANPQGIAICASLKVAGGPESIGIREGRKTTSRGDIATAWTLLMSGSSQESWMMNMSVTQDIPFTRLADSAVQIYSGCLSPGNGFVGFPDVFMHGPGKRECYKDTSASGEAVWYFWSQDGATYDSFQSPP